MYYLNIIYHTANESIKKKYKISEMIFTFRRKNYFNHILKKLVNVCKNFQKKKIHITKAY